MKTNYLQHNTLLAVARSTVVAALLLSLSGCDASQWLNDLFHLDTPAQTETSDTNRTDPTRTQPHPTNTPAPSTPGTPDSPTVTTEPDPLPTPDPDPAPQIQAVVTTQKVLAFQTDRNSNLLTNGSFELGLGAEPIYPGWMQRAFSTNMTPPALPTIDETTAASGQRSLKIARIGKNHKVTIDFTPPNISQTGKSRIYFGISAKSDCANLKLHFPATDKYLTTDWKRYTSFKDVAKKAYPVIRFEFLNDTAQDQCTLWIDDLVWSLSDTTNRPYVRSGSIESVLLPQRRNGIHYRHEDVQLTFAVDADSDRSDLGVELHLRDLTRGGTDRIYYQDTLALSAHQPTTQQVNLGILPKGAYMAHLVVYDTKTHAILSVARERFTVLADLAHTPPPIDFVAGMHGGFHAFTHSREFSWRGAWSADEYYANAYEIGLRAQRIFADATELVPQKGRYDLSILEPSIDTAAQHGCTTILSVDPFRPWVKGKAIPQGHDGDWIFTQGRDVSARAKSSLYNVYMLPEEDMKNLFVSIGKRFGTKLLALENTNELNMYYHPDNMAYAVEDIFKPMYSAFKQVAPNVPVMVDFTMDFYGLNYTTNFFAKGGIDYADGFTYHPYGREWIFYKDAGGDHDGIAFMKRNETYRSTASSATKKLVMGMSEVHSVGVYNAVGWDVLQRTLLDWSAGARFSSGMLSSGMYFLETRTAGEWNNRSTTAPGVGAVALNAMYAMLGGYQLVKRVTFANETGVLAVLFHNPKSGDYIAAMAQGDYPSQRAVLDLDLPSDAQFYDQWGEEIASPDPIKLSNEILYVRSHSSDLLKAFDAKGILQWVQEPNGYDYDSKHGLRLFSPGPSETWYAELLKTGIRPHTKR